MNYSIEDRKRKVYAVVEADMEYNDEYFYQNGEGYLMHLVFEDLEDAKKYALETLKINLNNYSYGDLDFDNFYPNLSIIPIVDDIAKQEALEKHQVPMRMVVDKLEATYGDKWVKYVPELVWIVEANFVEEIDPQVVEQKVTEIKERYC